MADGCMPVRWGQNCQIDNNNNNIIMFDASIKSTEYGLGVINMSEV